MKKYNGLLGCALLLSVFSGCHRVKPTKGTGLQSYIEKLESPERDSWQKPKLVTISLSLEPGAKVADIGAGSGYFTFPFAEKAGRSGLVYAIDIDQGMLAYIRQKNKREFPLLTNIKPVLTGPDRPGIKPGSVNLVFICNTFHHFTDRGQYLKRIRKILKKGGRLAIIDFKKTKTPFGPPTEMRISRDRLIKEVEAAGFIKKKEFKYLPYQNFIIFSEKR
ncbi:MAG: class I SAM-dependent methyltransferase [bacterium]